MKWVSEGKVMRRKDREIVNKAEIIEIIDKCEVCRLGLSDNKIPYVVPMNYGYKYQDGKLTLYFHGAREGKKLDIIAKNSKACFEVDCSHELVVGEEAWDYTMKYESVIGYGEIYICTDKSEVTEGLQLLMKQVVKDKEFIFPDKVVNSVTVLKLEVTEFTGKRNI